MLSPNFYPAVLAFSALLTLTNGQVFPKCIRTCIDSSQYSNCQVTDLACLCRAGRTSGSFLPDLVTCMHNSCIDVGVDLLLSPLQVTCVLAGAPLPDSAVKSAKSQASSLATQTQTEIQTTTATETATTEATRVVQTTITKTEQGSTRIIVIPLTIERTTTISGEPSTVTKDTTGTPTTSGKSATLSSVLSSLVSSARSSSLTSSPTSSSTSEESTTTILTSTTVLGEAVTSTISGSSTTQSGETTSTPGMQDSAPFINTNAARRAGSVIGGSWLGLGVWVIVGVVLF